MPFFFFKKESFLLNWISCVAYWVALGSSVPLIQGIWGEKTLRISLAVSLPRCPFLLSASR